MDASSGPIHGPSGRVDTQAPISDPSPCVPCAGPVNMRVALGAEWRLGPLIIPKLIQGGRRPLKGGPQPREIHFRLARAKKEAGRSLSKALPS